MPYRIAVRPQVSGIILKRNFKEGGDINISLYQIDPATYQAAYDGAKVIWRKPGCSQYRAIDGESLSEIARYSIHQ